MRWRWRRSPRDREALKKALAEPQPDSAADVPLRVGFGWGGAFGHALRLSFFGATLVAWHFFAGLEIGIALLLITVAHLLFGLAASLPDFTNLNLALSISAEGVRLEKIHRAYTIPWWDVQQIKAASDLQLIRIIGRNSRITFATHELSPDVRRQIVHALRAHVRDYALDISEWQATDRIVQQVLSSVFGAAGAGVFAVALILFAPGRTLGMRCSANSAFLQETFGTPQRQGCVVLRVSAGAEKAGILTGDLVIEMEGVPVTSGRQFSRLFDESNPPWEFTIIRNGELEPLDFEVEGGRSKKFKEANNDPFFYYLRARWDAGEEPERALADYSRAIELEPRFDLAHLYRAHLYEDRGDIDLARQDYETALDLTPELGEAHSSYAYFLSPDDRAGARRHIERAIELDRCTGAFERYNVDCATHYLLVSSLEAMEDIARMAEAAEQSIRFYPNFADSYYQSACAHGALGDQERAREHARRYLDFPAGKQEAVRKQHMREILERDGASCR